MTSAGILTILMSDTSDFDSLLKKLEDLRAKSDPKETEKQEPEKQDPENCPCVLRDLFTKEDVTFLTKTQKGKDALKVFVDSII
jgi:hypothetical protein